MAQSKHQIQELLARANSQPRHRFGQNFMIDQNLVRLVADAGEIAAGDGVIEVGPGTGTLTEELMARGGDVVAVEIDRDLARMLRDRFGVGPAEGDSEASAAAGDVAAADHRFRLIEGDALASKHELNPALLDLIGAWKAEHPPRTVRLVANLPYNIASPLVVELLAAGVDVLAFTVQKEVADRLRGKPGTDDYGPLTVIVQRLARVEVLRTLPAQAFWPAPKIESALVRLRRDDRVGGEARAFSAFVHRLFAARRKTLRKALDVAGHDPGPALAATGLDPKVRPEVLGPEALWGLYEAVAGAT